MASFTRSAFVSTQRLIIAALDTACRRGELLALQWSDVSLAKGEIAIRAENAKTKRRRVLPISPRLRASWS